MATSDPAPMPHTLLLADDSVTIQRVIALTFAGEQIAVVAVNDGDEAIERLRHSQPDIVLADTGMPGRSGYEVARHIKSTPELAHIPVLLLAGAFETVDPDRLAAAGCDGVLMKPFEPQAVVQRVRELLGRESPPRRAVVHPPVDEGAPVFADPVGDETAAAVEERFENPAQMSEVLSSPPPAMAPVLDEAIDHGFAAAEPVPADDRSPGRPARLDDYFDQLDRAIAARVGEQANAPAAATTPVPASAADTDSESEQAPAERPVLADAFSALLAAEESETADPVTAMQSLLPRAPVVAAAPPPPVVVPPVPPTIVVSEEIVEKVVRRVLEEMTGRALREAVAEVTAATAERLILEEIARIKSNIP